MKDAIHEAFREFCKEHSYNFKLSEEGKWYTAMFDIKSGLKTCDVTVFAWSDMLAFMVMTDLKVEKEQRANMAMFLTLVNNELFYTHFKLDLADGSIESSGSMVVKTNPPNDDEIELLLSESILALEQYGDDILKVAAGEDAQKVFESLPKE